MRIKNLIGTEIQTMKELCDLSFVQIRIVIGSGIRIEIGMGAELRTGTGSELKVRLKLRTILGLKTSVGLEFESNVCGIEIENEIDLRLTSIDAKDEKIILCPC
ncbi:hypothetical protein EVAR_34833_1 [Eumeta japonica]|uniref:Uncharacterized protein n=1 Tax=Eumeta variegata TaxID=151549 RepID=A0A4C1YU79_EUMVA|nr:hypothetical protein EVAR_34833_1 [Eumeta japonica]